MVRGRARSKDYFYILIFTISIRLSAYSLKGGGAAKANVRSVLF
jgi:hypothetical protein